MKRIVDIDKNFSVETSTPHEDAVFYDPKREPFSVHGVFYENGKFRRIPEELASRVNEGVLCLHANAAGGRIRFRTDSPYIIINARMSGVDRMPHFALTGSSGFDLYIDGAYESSFIPPMDLSDGYESCAELGPEQPRDVTIHMPLYSNVNSLAIGLAAGSSLGAAKSYADIPPIVYYGSSITQGGCASRPGNAYENIVTRRLNVDHVNLGFSGSARGEDAITDYIRSLDMSVFVLDYDHNAPDAEHLSNTHEKMFLSIRESRPDLPILLMSRPRFSLSDDEGKRLSIVRQTYLNARARGDKNVGILSGPALMALAGDDGTVDGCHPNDLGFFSMAQAVTAALEPMVRRTADS